MFIILSEDLVALGGFKQKGRDDMEPLLPETEQILERCKRLVPSLKVRLQCVIVLFPHGRIQRGGGRGSGSPRTSQVAIGFLRNTGTDPP